MSEVRIQALEEQVVELKKEVAQNKKDISDLKNALHNHTTVSPGQNYHGHDLL